MANMRPFRCIRPNKEVASQVAALPYDVYNRQEAKAVVEKNPMSFLAIDRAETQFGDTTDVHDPAVYAKAKEMLEQWLERGIFEEDSQVCYYIYELTMYGRSQTGIVGCASIDDYVNGIIRKHENTREDKEQDRICHVDVMDAHTGPIFLAYRSDEELNRIVSEVCRKEALYDFTSEDGIRHRVWKIGEEDIAEDKGKAESPGRTGKMMECRTVRIQERFRQMTEIYIADGHHRAASAVKVGLKRRKENPGYTGEEPFNFFLSVLFPDDQLMIMPYNRVVKDLNGRTEEEFLDRVRERFVVRDRTDTVRDEENADSGMEGTCGCQPQERHHVGMYLAGKWYELVMKPEYMTDDPVRGLDVSLLQDNLLTPVLGIGDPRTDERIRFVGGIRGLAELERLVDGGEGAVAFAMYPTSIQELFSVADAGLLMPPKSTWFEPKLRSGLFIHKLS